jgi:hypothetical protein
MILNCDNRGRLGWQPLSSKAGTFDVACWQILSHKSAVVDGRSAIWLNTAGFDLGHLQAAHHGSTSQLIPPRLPYATMRDRRVESMASTSSAGRGGLSR